MPIIDDLQHVLPELFLAVMAMALLIYGVFNGNKVTGLALKVAVGVLLLTAAIMFGFAPNAVGELENNFDFDKTCACTSSPIIVSQGPMSPSIKYPISLPS